MKIATAPAQFVICTSNGFISGYSAQWMCVQFTDEPKFVKTFKTARAATAWAMRYSERGYGLPAGSWTIQTI